MNEELTKSLTDLIDETLMELEELKKSRFSPAEIKIEGPGDGIAGKPSDGKLDAAKAEDDKDEDDKDEDKAEKAEKDEDPADAPEVGRKLKELTEKAEKEDKEDEDEDEDKKEPHKEDPKHEAKEKAKIKELADMHGMKKSEEELSSLMKSYVDERVKPLEDKLSSIFDLVHKIAEQPAAPKGATARTVPLMKSVDEAGEPLSKAQVASKLFELKKSGSSVDSLDVTKAEMGQDLENIVKKYKLS